jgi:hypothetical protein
MTGVTEKQLEANRTNAKLGGVKTDKGKAVSKLNAIKHGLLSEDILLIGESEANFAQMSRSIWRQYKPLNEIENILVDRIVSCIWRLKRAGKIETSLMDFERVKSQKEDLSDFLGGWKSNTDKTNESYTAMINNNIIEKLNRYENTLERAMYKAMHELERIQGSRSGKDVKPPMAIDIDVNESDKNGFVSQ